MLFSFISQKGNQNIQTPFGTATSPDFEFCEKVGVDSLEVVKVLEENGLISDDCVLLIDEMDL